MIQKKWALDTFETTHTQIRKYHVDMVPQVFPILENSRKMLERVAPWICQIKTSENLEYYIDLITQEWSDGASLRYALFNIKKISILAISAFTTFARTIRSVQWVTGQSLAQTLEIF